MNQTNKDAAAATSKRLVVLDLTKSQGTPGESSAADMQHDKSNMFALTEEWDSKRSNRKYICLTCGDGKLVWSSHADSHVKTCHPNLYTTYCEAKRKKQAVLGGRINFEKKSEVTEEEREIMRKYAGTQANLNAHLANLVAVGRLPFEFVERQELRDLVQVAINFGAKAPETELRQYMVPSRKTLLRFLEGNDGLLSQTVDSALEEFRVAARDGATSIIFDGAKDATGRSLELFCIQSQSRVMVLWTGLPNDHQKNSEWTYNCLAGLLEGNMDFELMNARSANLDEEDEEESGSETDAPKVTKKPRTELVPQISRLFEMSKFVCAAGGDNASVPRAAARALAKEHGTIPFGCVCHALNRCYEHVANIPAIKTEIVVLVEAITDLFLSRTYIRELLRKRCEKSVYRIVPTRFISLFIACERLVELKKHLAAVVDSPKFQEFKNRSVQELKEQCILVKKTVEDEMFWGRLTFFTKFSLGFVVAIRCFDGALAGSVCLVYKFWSLLSQTIVSVFKEHKDLCSSFATAELYADVVAVVEKNWEKFHFSVYSAGYFLAPQFIHEIREMRDTEPDVYAKLFRETVDIVIQVSRRFDESARPRAAPLRANDPIILELREKVESEIGDFVHMRGNFNVAMFSDTSVAKAPVDWWSTRAATSSIRAAAIKIVTLSPSTSPVERLHKQTKSIRTKSRNRLGYARALALNFICCENLMKARPWDAKFAWSHLRTTFQKTLSALGTEEKNYLERLNQESETELEALRVVAEEECILTVDVLATEIAATARTRQASAEEGLEDDVQGMDDDYPIDHPRASNVLADFSEPGAEISDDAEDELGLQEANQEHVTEKTSRTGRPIRKRIFKDFVM
jgi:hypothetical protein